MGQIVKRKKKGRPSKADLARRLEEAAQASESDIRRSLRRRNVRYNIDYDDYLDEDEEDEEEDEMRREKKLKLVVTLNQGHRGAESPSSGTLSAARRVHAVEDGDDEEEDESERKPLKKRRISGGDDDEEEEDEDDDHGGEDEEEKGRRADSKGHDSVPGTPSDPPSEHPLPDKKSLELILDKLQKKDIYGVYAEPVDPEELPDYHEVIEHPMDFATVRKKMANGAYSSLEQFKSDVFLICSNAMQYNASDTIYYKQARSIEELAIKKFQRLRTAIERSEKELKSEQKSKSNLLVKKQMKKPLGRTMQEPVGSDFSSGATLATAGDVQNGSIPAQAGGYERPSYADGSVDGNSALVENNLEKVEELSSGKVLVSKLGRKPSVLDENRRSTYLISTQPVLKSDSVFSTFEDETKQLVAVGLHAEYSYARSLARFAATLGPVAWKVASQRIEQALPVGYKFGRGWVGEYEPLPTPVLILESRVQKESALFTKLQSAADVLPAKVHPVSRALERKQSSVHSVAGPKSEGKLALLAAAAGTKPNTPINANHQQQNPFSRMFEKPENKFTKQVELNLPPVASPKNTEQFLDKSDVAVPRSSGTVSKNTSALHDVPQKQLNSNGSGGGLPNGKIPGNCLNNGMMRPSSSDQMGRSAAHFHHGQEQGLSDPVQLMRMLAEKSQMQQNPKNQSEKNQMRQNSRNQSPADTPQVTPSVPQARRGDSSTNDAANAAQAAARAWMSIGAGGFKQVTEKSSAPKHQMSAESLCNSAQESHPQTSQGRADAGMQVRSERSNSFPQQKFELQPIRSVNEVPLPTERSNSFPQQKFEPQPIRSINEVPFPTERNSSFPQPKFESQPVRSVNEVWLPTERSSSFPQQKFEPQPVRSVNEVWLPTERSSSFPQQKFERQPICSVNEVPFPSERSNSFPQQKFEPQPVSSANEVPFPTESKSFLPQKFEPQPIRSVNEVQFPSERSKDFRQQKFEPQPIRSVNEVSFPSERSKSFPQQKFEPHPIRSVNKVQFPSGNSKSFPRQKFEPQPTRSVNEVLFPPERIKNFPQQKFEPQPIRSVDEVQFPSERSKNFPQQKFEPQPICSVNEVQFPSERSKSFPQQKFEPQPIRAVDEVQFPSERSKCFPQQKFEAQLIRSVHEVPFDLRPTVFPQSVAATDLSKFQMQAAWRALAPHTQPRKKQETLPPDLNISFQSPGSPVKQSSSVLVDSQQPDLALQL